MSYSITNSENWFARAQAVIPGGVSSPVRAFSAVGGTPLFMVRGEGSYVFDVDGNKYVDFVGSWGPMILGHAHPQVMSAVVEATQNSSSFGAPSHHEVELAEEIIRRVPTAERVRFVSSGTEAVMTAVRLARAATGRNVIVKFAGCYHGHSDALLVQAGSGVLTLGLPNSPGVTTGQAQDTVVLEYNDVASLKALFAERGPEIAAMITEAVPANMGVVPPLDNFNKILADTAHQNGALLILDEVMTGFRISAGGYFQTVADQGWQPDILTFGKVIGGGYPLAALGGRKEIMEQLAPLGPVYQAGTLSGNPVATTAGLAQLKFCTPELYANLDLRAQEIGTGLSEIFAAAGIAHQFQNVGNLFSFFFTEHQVNSFADAKSQDTKFFARFFHKMLENGVSLPPSAFEAWFVNGAMDEREVEITLAAAKKSI